MTDAVATPGAPPPLPSLPARVIGVLFSPRETFTALAARPKWAGMLALTLVVAALALGLFLTTEVGKQALLDQQVTSMESFGVKVTDQMYEQLQTRARFMPYVQAGSILVVGPIVVFVIAGILLGIFNALLGGDASYRQVLAILTHAGAVTIVQYLFTMPLNYARESLSSPANLGVFLPMLDEHGWLGSLLGMIDLFVIWWVTVLAIGLAVLYRRRTRPILISLLAVYGVIALAVVGVKRALGGA